MTESPTAPLGSKQAHREASARDKSARRFLLRLSLINWGIAIVAWTISAYLGITSPASIIVYSVLFVIGLIAVIMALLTYLLEKFAHRPPDYEHADLDDGADVGDPAAVAATGTAAAVAGKAAAAPEKAAPAADKPAADKPASAAAKSAPAATAAEVKAPPVSDKPAADKAAPASGEPTPPPSEAKAAPAADKPAPARGESTPLPAEPKAAPAADQPARPAAADQPARPAADGKAAPGGADVARGDAPAAPAD